MQFVIISGMSGAGKSKAASDLEDLGFYCVDNMPAEMIPQFAQLCLATKGRYEKVALVTDIRASMTFDSLFQSLQKLDEMHLQYSIYFVEASTEVIIKRYKETRRLHPLMKDGSTLQGAIARERELLAPVRNRANAIIDTSNLSTGKLRGMLIDLAAGGLREHSMNVRVVSFGFKYGLPLEADLVFDVRFLPNPYYIPELKTQTGMDEPDLADPGIVDLFGVEDLALAEHAAAVVELRFQMHILIRDRQHAAGDGEDVSHAVYGLVKRAGNAVHGS